MKLEAAKMKSSTYASVLTIVFLIHKDKISKSIESAIRTTDKFCEQLGFQNNLSHMTKYRVISDLSQSKIIASQYSKKNKKLRLTKTITDLL
jgi:alcohol dehydrogenase YqhD (iron-dependent ADH family)